MLRYFENGEDVPFAVEFRESGAIDSYSDRKSNV